MPAHLTVRVHISRAQPNNLQPTVIPLFKGDEAISVKDLTAPKSSYVYSADAAGKYYSVAEYHSIYLSGELTPRAVVESLIPMISRDIAPRDVHSLAFITSNIEAIRHAASLSTQRYKAGASIGILDGIPIGIKDEVDAAGYRTTYGRKPNDALFPTKLESAWPVHMLEKAGAIVMGKMNMHEIGMGNYSFLSPISIVFPHFRSERNRTPTSLQVWRGHGNLTLRTELTSNQTQLIIM